MAVVSNPLIGNARQSAGGMTFSKWKGLNVLKNKATSVANPKTNGQLAQRSAMSQTVVIFRQISAVVKLGFKKGLAHMSEFNRFSSVTLKNAFNLSAPPVATFLPEELITSKGTITQTAIATLVADRSLNQINFTWATSITGPGQSLTDRAAGVAYNVTKDEWASVAFIDVRSGGQGPVVMPAGWAIGDAVRGYLSFYNPLSGESSDSTTDTTTLIA